MATPAAPGPDLGRDSLRYLSGAEVAACLPPVPERLNLAARALAALNRGDVEMPAKIGVHPRRGALLHAMPAWDRLSDVVGMKWVAAYPAGAASGIRAVNALIVLNDASNGVPICVMDGTEITTARTAAVSGVALQCFAPAGAHRVGMIGAGVQGRGHVPIIAHLMPGARIRIFDRYPERAEAFATWAAEMPGIAAAVPATSAEGAVADAEVVLTMGSLGSMQQVMTTGWLQPGGLVVAIDFATHVSAELARSAALFATDDRPQFIAYRDNGTFADFPDPNITIGEAVDLRAREAAPRADPSTRVVVCHLGVGIADVVFAEASRRLAEERGIGHLLPV